MNFLSIKLFATNYDGCISNDSIYTLKNFLNIRSNTVRLSAIQLGRVIEHLCNFCSYRTEFLLILKSSCSKDKYFFNLIYQVKFDKLQLDHVRSGLISSYTTLIR